MKILTWGGSGLVLYYKSIEGQLTWPPIKRIEIDSNTVERCIKPIRLGRKNYLFAGSEGGAETWTTLASLINSAKLHDMDLRHYLTDALKRIVSGRTKINQLNTLLPRNWKAERDGSEAKLAA